MLNATQTKKYSLLLSLGFPLSLIMAAAFVARAYDSTWIADGQPVSAAQLKGNLDEIQTRLAKLESMSVSSAGPSGTTVYDAVVTPVAGQANCTLTQDGSWITGAVHPSIGTCQLVFTQNVFHAAPVCVATSAFYVSTILGVSTSGLTVDMEDTNGAHTIEGRAINLVCIGH